MLTDAHCHPYDLRKIFPGMEEERRRLGALCAASASDREEFEYNERLAAQAKADSAIALFPCFAVHPQSAAYIGSLAGDAERQDTGAVIDGRLKLLENLAGQGRLAAVGETGFDLYNAQYRETEAIQDKIFAIHVEIALRFELPLVLHVRRAMHKIFAVSAKLKKCRAVVFHSWSGTAGEAQALLGRGINAYFSFGTPLLLNRGRAMLSCASLPAQRLLLETDAPYQPLYKTGRQYSSWEDLPAILNAAAALLREAGSQVSDAAELEHLIEGNFHEVFALPAANH